MAAKPIAPPASARQVVRCDECNVPILEIRDGVILIKSRHHGTNHVSLIPLRELLELLGIKLEGLQ